MRYKLSPSESRSPSRWSLPAATICGGCWPNPSAATAPDTCPDSTALLIKDCTRGQLIPCCAAAWRRGIPLATAAASAPSKSPRRELAKPGAAAIFSNGTDDTGAAIAPLAHHSAIPSPSTLCIGTLPLSCGDHAAAVFLFGSAYCAL